MSAAELHTVLFCPENSDYADTTPRPRLKDRPKQFSCLRTSEVEVIPDNLKS